MAVISEESVADIQKTLSRFVSGVTGGHKIDADALTLTPIDELRAAVVSELESSSLRDHLHLINSKNQFTLACYVAADFTSSHPLEYQVLMAQLTIFFFHAEDILKHKPEVLRRLQLNVATACYDFINGIGIELLTKDAKLHPQAPSFPDWLRFKTGLSPMYALLVLARASDMELPTGGFGKFVQAIPDVITFTNIVNDVISFYKELLAGEKGNYIDMRAQKDGVDVVTGLRTLADEGMRVHGRITAALADEPEYRANFDAYAKGITYFHTSSPRYRLAELFETPRIENHR